MQCPACNAYNPEGSITCSCGQDLTGGQAIRAAVPPGARSDELPTAEYFSTESVECPNCSKLSPPGTTKCECGFDLTRKYSATSDKPGWAWLFVVACAAIPVVSLVGMVFGMILSFREQGRGQQPNAAKLAEGISHALVVTLLGAVIGVAGALGCFAVARIATMPMAARLGICVAITCGCWLAASVGLGR
jgi:hypothetical protein